MPAQSFHEVNCTGHGSYPPRSTTGVIVTDVFVNNKEILVVGDAFVTHKKPGSNPNPHGSTVSAGSGTVFANNIPVARIGDPVACGSSVAEGSPNVITGG